MWYSGAIALQAYVQTAQQATRDCLRDGSLPISLYNVAMCIKEEFDEVPYSPPRAVAVGAESADSPVGVVLWAPLGKFIFALHNLYIPDGSPGGALIRLTAAILPPINAS